MSQSAVRGAASRLCPLATVCCLLLSSGCAALRYTNTAPCIEHDVRASKVSLEAMVLNAVVAVPARDLLTFEWLGRLLSHDRAWNADTDFAQGTSFYTPRTDDELSPERVALGPCSEPPPKLPFKLEQRKDDGYSPGFWGRDATGRKFLVKVDDPNFPELGSGATIVASRILWACGCNVSAEYLVPRVEGTGDATFDGRRATASLFIPHVQGWFDFDWFRYRREVRALRLLAAWVNDPDRQSKNSLVVVEDGCAKYYQIDFNGALGSWQGWPKESWRGYQY